MSKVVLTATDLTVLIGGYEYRKGSIVAREEGNGYRFYSKDPLYPITTWVSLANAVDGNRDPFANKSALDAWVASNVNVIVSVPAPPESGTFTLTSTDGMLSWEAAE